MTFTQSLGGLLLAIGFTSSSIASAAMLTINPSKDNSIYANSTDNSNALVGVFAGNNSSGAERRGLIAFDFSAIPSGSTINSVTLNLVAINGITAGNDFTLYRLLTDWGEGTSSNGNTNGGGGGNGAPATAGDATWNANIFGSSNWSTAGGDFSVSASAISTTPATPLMTWTSAQLAVDVQNWIDGISSNHGWALVGPGGANTATKFGSREASAANRPELVVDFTAAAVPAPAAVWLFGSGLVGLIGVARRRR